MSCHCGWRSGFYRGGFEVHIRPLSAWEESLPKEPKPEKSKEKRLLFCFIYLLPLSQLHVTPKMFIIMIFLSSSSHLVQQFAQYHNILSKSKWKKSQCCPPMVCSDRGDPRLPGEPELCVVQSGGRGQPRSVEAVRRRHLSTHLSVLSPTLDAVYFVILFVQC